MSEFNAEELIKLANSKMPFGKYRGQFLIDLPEPYVVWFYHQGFPNNELGRLLTQIYEIKLNGLEYLIKPLIEKNRATLPDQTHNY